MNGSPNQPVSELPNTGGTPRGPEADRAGRAKRPRWLLWVTALLGVLAIVYLTTHFLGHVHGEEFSPTTFERRSFAYYQIPLLRIQVTPVVRQVTTNDLESIVRQEILVSQTSKGAPRWDLVRAHQAGRQVFAGDAHILCTYLDTRTSTGGLIWQQWTEENGELARILWAEVQELAEYGLYLLVPDLFELAENTGEADVFQQAVDRRLADRYDQLAAVERELGNPRRAESLGERAARHRRRERDTSDLEQSAGISRRLGRQRGRLDATDFGQAGGGMHDQCGFIGTLPPLGVR